MEDHQSSNLLPALTFVLWAGCLAVGVAGLRLAYPRPRPPPALPAPVQATVLQVQVQRETLAPPVNGPSAPSQPEVAPAPLPSPEKLPQIAPDESPPPLVSLAALNPFVEHVQPEPVAIRNVPVTKAVASAPAIQQLTLGVGEGFQPMPVYPREAQIARQEGVVVVRFSVTPDGSVENVEAIKPCPFALLNQAAVRAVRDTWRFVPGPPRLFEVSISFQLRKNN